MTINKPILFAACILFFSTGSSLGNTGNTRSAFHKNSYKKGEILIKYKEDASRAKVRKRYSRTNRTIRLKSVSRSGIEHLKLPRGIRVKDAVRQYRSNPDVEFAEPNYVYKINTIPDDTFFDELWALQHYNDHDIDAPETWDIIRYADDVIVAVIDSGIDYNHPDLSANIWTNQNEIPGNSIDDDGNGKIDDFRGWDFVNDDNDPMDLNGHGTHVSGTIGAESDNAIGVAGVAWNVNLMAVRGLGASGWGYTSDLIEAIEYADSMGADIVNLSWGGEEFSEALKEVIQNSDALFICSAGNDSENIDSIPKYPAAYDCRNIISVAASNRYDRIAKFSNYGKTGVDLVAPGVDIYSTITPRKTLFTETFKTSQLEGWVTGGEKNAWGIERYGYSEPFSLSDSPNGYTEPGTNSWIKSRVFDLSDESYVSIEFELYHDIAQDDYLNLEISFNGTTWTKLEQYTGFSEGWISEGFDLTLLEGRSQAWIRARMVTSGWDTEGCNIDDIIVESSCEDYEEAGYQYMSGTSMAAPHVAGIAALVKSFFPGFSSYEIKAAIENNVDFKPLLMNKLATGGRANLYRVIDYLNSLDFESGEEIDLAGSRDSIFKGPDVAVNTGNTAAVVWSENNQCIKGQIINPSGIKKENDFCVEKSISVGTDPRISVQVASLSNDNFLVGYQTSAQGSILAKIIDEAGRTVEKGIFIADRADPGFKLTGLAAGGFAAVYTQDDQTLYARLFGNDGTASSPEIQIASGSGISPDVCGLKNGGFAVTYQLLRDTDSIISNICVQIFDAAGNPSTSLLKIGQTTDLFKRSLIESLGNGNMVVAWKDFALNRYKDSLQIISSEGKRIGMPFQLRTGYASDTAPGIEAVSSTGNGHFMVTFNADIVYPYGTFAQIFTNDGSKTGKPFPVHSDYESPSFASASAGLDDPDSFLVVWQIEDLTGIFARYLTYRFTDQDGDGIFDFLEADSCSDINAFDTDNDGISDGVEDANRNGMIDDGETSPCDPDTDNDGIDDGVEDANHNGIVDLGETDPLIVDTYDDGTQGSTEPGLEFCENSNKKTDPGGSSAAVIPFMPVFSQPSDVAISWPLGAPGFILKDAGRFKIYFENNAVTGQYGYDLASSFDGFSWALLQNNLVDISTTGKPVNKGISVIKEKNLYKAWVLAGNDMPASGRSFIHYLISQDSITWTDQGSSKGYGSFFDPAMIDSLDVVSQDGLYHVYYTGSEDQYGDNRKIMHGVSADGINWVKIQTVFDTEAYNPKVLVSSNTWEMFYIGDEDSNGSNNIYYATSSDGFAWTKQGLISSLPQGVISIHVQNDTNKYYLWLETGTGLYYYTADNNDTSITSP